MFKKVLFTSIAVGLLVTFVGVFIKLYPTVEEHKEILNRSLEFNVLVPKEGKFYTLDPKTQRLIIWDKPERYK
jgi:hypothetical protein|tara:strand:+ start:4915 stop:5133 length:219 start_codon:yes stop_codon:yes gene_type:complete